MGKFIDLTGQTFGRWTVLGRAANSKGGKTRFNCQCTCGQHKTVIGLHLRNGQTKSCGCLQRELASTRSLKKLTGQSFGYLTVLKPDKSKSNRSVNWLCRCECGSEKIANGHLLRKGEVRSCGCVSHASMVLKQSGLPREKQSFELLQTMQLKYEIDHYLKEKQV